MRSRPATLALALLAGCSSDLFHSTNWSPDCGSDCEPITTTTVGSGASGGSGGGVTASSSSAASGGGGGTGGVGGACVTCADALSGGADDQTAFCTGSHDLYLGVQNACCDATAVCAAACSESVCTN